MSEELPIEEKIIQHLRKSQDLGYAIIGGVSAALIGAVLWAVITVATNYQIGYMAIGVGLLAGFAVRFFGAGVDFQYRIVGAACALLGCMLGNLFSQVWFIAEAESISYMQVLSLLTLDIILSIYQETFGFMDLLFYGIAVYEGYRFAVREVTDEMIEEYNTNGSVSPQANSKLRLPIVITCFVSIGVLWFMVSRESSGPRTYFYPSGEKMSEGELVDNKEEGPWAYYYQSGSLQASGNYKSGVEDGEWQWYTEDGTVVKKGSYQYGLEEGPWVFYYATGAVADSGSFSQGRETGEWIRKNEAGIITGRTVYERSNPNGESLSFYDDGTPLSKGSFNKGIQTGRWQFWHKNGKLSLESDYIREDEIKIVNAWDETGKQMVSNGNGTITDFYENKNVKEVSQVTNGKLTGTWKKFYESGEKKEEGEFKDNIRLVWTAWSPDGRPELTDGNGTYTMYADDNTTVLERGELKNGLRDGFWTRFYDNGTDTLQTATFVNGKMNGPYRTYFQDGTLQLQGMLMDDKREGEWIWYFDSGAIESTVTYAANKKTGEQTFFNRAGIELKKEVYADDELTAVTLSLKEDQD